MKTTTKQRGHYIDIEPTLYMALELGEKEWKLGFSVGLGQRPRLRRMKGSDLKALHREVLRAKRRFGLPETAVVVSCYEAGQEGFWLDRYLKREGIENSVVDSSSIEVNRKARRAKSDGMDARKLVEMLIRYQQGESRVWRVVHVPSREDEDDRHLNRNLKRLKQDQTAIGNGIRGLLKTQGIRWFRPIRQLDSEQLEQLRDWEGLALRKGLKDRIRTRILLLQQVGEQILRLERLRRQMLREKKEGKFEQIVRLESLKGIGINGAWTLVMEAYGWRDFKNRRQVAGCLGVTPSPYQSGNLRREQGISKAGNHWCRDVLGEVAWTWVQFQPQSELTQWFKQRFEKAGPTARKIGIVAVARKLAIQLWQFLEFGVVPPGAVFYSRL